MWHLVVSWLKRHPLIGYFVLADAITWLIAAPLIATAQGALTVPVPPALHYLTAYGPLAAALIMTRVVEGRAGLRELSGRLLWWRVGLGWWLVAVGSPVALFALAAVIARALGEPWPDLRRLGEVNFLPDLGVGALLLWTLTSGLGEEVGWRGYALPHLQRERSALTASLILGGLWALWHLPAFFYLPTY